MTQDGDDDDDDDDDDDGDDDDDDDDDEDEDEHACMHFEDTEWGRRREYPNQSMYGLKLPKQ